MNTKWEEIKSILDDWGFKKYLREVEQSSKDHYGETITVIEEWNNEDIAKFIAEEYKTFIKDQITKAQQEIAEQIIGDIPDLDTWVDGVNVAPVARSIKDQLRKKYL